MVGGVWWLSVFACVCLVAFVCVVLFVAVSNRLCVIGCACGSMWYCCVCVCDCACLLLFFWGGACLFVFA